MKFIDPLVPHDAGVDRVRDGLYDIERRRIQVPTFQIKGGGNTYGVLDLLEVEGGGIAALGTNLNRVALTPGFDNRLINGCFRVNQRAPSTSADDTYAHDRWYALTQTNTIAVSTLTDVEDTTPYMARLTQSQAVAQRMGYAQIIEGKNCKDLRGQAVTFSFRARLSSSADIRYAVLEWTGTEDSVTSDVILDWTSASYAANAFFLAASVTVSGVGECAMTANTLTTPDKLTVTLGSSFNNLIVLVWTEGTAAQNVTLDIGKAKLEPGSAASRFLWIPMEYLVPMCERYYEKSYNLSTPPGTVTTVGAYEGNIRISTTTMSASLSFNTRKRASPTMTGYSSSNGAGGKWYDGTANLAVSFGNTGEAYSLAYNNATTAGRPFYGHWTAEIEL